ncbi:MAG TPA: efflux RND transporter periplasmic adaptor subunit [Phycisphaerae bacterium]|nr:efflux RND transporter periplasmic adaptor subunit [Phycisphaerae bacterium]
MSSQPDIRAQLRSLSIPKDQRPSARAMPAAVPTKRNWRWFVVAAVAIGGGYLVYRFLPGAGAFIRAAAPAEEVPLITVTERGEAGPMTVHTATGKIVSDHKVKVTTKVSGQIVELLFEQGDRIEEGQVLARLEDVLPRARRNEAAAALEKSKANLAYQRVSFDRIEKLYKISSAPEIEYADSLRALKEAEAQVEQNEAGLSWAEKVLRDCEVVAPIGGVILERNVEVGDFVAAEGGIGAMANAQFGTIADMTKLRVEVDISELDISRLKKNMRCVITPDAYKDRKYDGYVMWIDPGANYSKATVQVKVRILNPDVQLRVEGVAQVVFLSEQVDPDAPEVKVAADVASKTGGIWIPIEACEIDAGGKAGRVFVAQDGKLHETPVIVGQKVAGQLEIISGLQAGQSIAASHIGAVESGQRIKQ